MRDNSYGSPIPQRPQASLVPAPQPVLRGQIVIGGGPAVMPGRPSVLPVYVADQHIGYIQRVGKVFRLLTVSGRLTHLGHNHHPDTRQEAAQILLDAWNRGAEVGRNVLDGDEVI